MQSQERNTGEYDGVSVSGSFDVELIGGTEGEVVVTAEENLQEYIITEVRRGTLVIKIEEGVNLSPSISKGLSVTVPVSEIESVSLSGSGEVIGKTRLKASEFHASMSGSGDVELEVDADELSAALSGSGDINLSGSAGHFNVEISGSGDVQAFGLEAREVNASISGSADIEVTANEVLNARVSGSGNIRYRGDATKVHSVSSGSGDITRG